MKERCRTITIGALLVMVFVSWGVLGLLATAKEDTTVRSNLSDFGFSGSVSCRKCHEKFYQLWASSHHWLAMQPFTVELARNKLSPQTE